MSAHHLGLVSFLPVMIVSTCSLRTPSICHQAHLFRTQDLWLSSLPGLLRRFAGPDAHLGTQQLLHECISQTYLHINMAPKPYYQSPLLFFTLASLAAASIQRLPWKPWRILNFLLSPPLLISSHLSSLPLFRGLCHLTHGHSWPPTIPALSLRCRQRDFSKTNLIMSPLTFKAFVSPPFQSRQRGIQGPSSCGSSQSSFLFEFPPLMCVSDFII